MDLRWPLRITEDRPDGTGVLVLALGGRIGAASAARLDSALGEAVARANGRVVVDLAEVDYVSSAGLNALSAARDRCAAAGGAFVACAVLDPVKIALDLGGLQIPIEATRDEAIRRAALPDAGPHSG
jgi:anti-sigma B factor antagonist